ncbi:MAG: GspH/FimT family pseudopilin [Gemmatimonadales bacterium]
MVLIGLMLAIALPRLRAFADGMAVERAARELAAAHRRARMAAVLQGRVLELTVNANDLDVRPRGDSTRLWHADGPAAGGVTLAGPQRTLSFSPVGMSLGLSNATFLLTRGTATRSVVVSRLGRVRILP